MQDTNSSHTISNENIPETEAFWVSEEMEFSLCWELWNVGREGGEEGDEGMEGIGG